MPSPSNPERQRSYHVEISTGLARRLRETRLGKGMSTAALAKAAGVGRTLILVAENPESGGGGMSLAALAALADALGVSRGWLAFGT
jgi:transcriptional regulator with XRE-family HTH domain